MLNLSIALGLFLGSPGPAPQGDRPEVEVPGEELVERTLERLEAAFSKDGEEADRVAALRAAAEVPDARVVKVVAKALGEREVAVQKAALECLRFLDHEAALDALHAVARRDRKLLKDPERAPLLLRAIGEHGSPRSIEVLAGDVYGVPEERIVRARILAIANIRSRESVETLVDLMNRAGRQQLQPHLATFRLALVRLTGVDRGRTLDGWQRWWNDAKRDLEVAAEPPRMSRADLLDWERFWGREQTRQRADRRRKRGGDGG